MLAPIVQPIITAPLSLNPLPSAPITIGPTPYIEVPTKLWLGDSVWVAFSDDDYFPSRMVSATPTFPIDEVLGRTSLLAPAEDFHIYVDDASRLTLAAWKSHRDKASTVWTFKVYASVPEAMVAFKDRQRGGPGA